MAGYGVVSTIVAMLGPSEPSGGFQAGLEARIDAMQETVSTLVEEATGRAWSEDAAPSVTRTIYPVGGASDVLVLPVPAQTITAITVGGIDEGGTVSGGTALDVAGWSVAYRDANGDITAIRLWSGAAWVGWRSVTITGTWADTAGAVPTELVWVVNYVTAERIKQEQASPAGFSGADGTVTPIRNPWADPQVKAILRKHRLVTKGLVV
jgi:hypothetical protein